MNILYTLFIYPIEQILELFFIFIFRITKSTGLSIVGLSVTVSTLVLPFYFMAEKQQKAERSIQKMMKDKIAAIKAVFKGDKRFMLLSTYYRQQNYHPIYAIRNSIDLIIQVPFFIAAYHFLSNLNLLNGESFAFIKDLSLPDGILGSKGGGINILPIIMTIINILTGYIYTKNLETKDKIQVCAVSLIFLVLLYNSPSGLVLYWTCNNIYNLFKNIFLKLKNRILIIKTFIITLCVIFIAYILFIHSGSFIKRSFSALIFILVLLFPLWNYLWIKIQKKINIKDTSLEFPAKTYFLSLTGLFLLIGLVIPSSIISSSVEEFSFLDPFLSPLPYLGIIFLQSLGFLILLTAVYFLFSSQIRKVLTAILTITLGVFTLNTFTIPMDYGILTPDLFFSNFSPPALKSSFVNLIFILCTFFSLAFLLLFKKKKILLAIQYIMVISFLFFGVFNIIKINNEFIAVSELKNNESSQTELDKIFTFSKTGKNIIVIMLDKATQGYTPYIFEEKPELLDAFKGFTLYKNTAAFGGYTIYGIPSIFGGYYYTPSEIQRRSNELWKDKFFESYHVLPRILQDADFNVSLFNLPWADNTVFNNYEKIRGYNLSKGFINKYMELNKDLLLVNYYKILNNNLIRFSFFRASPLILHEIMYGNGKYISIFDPKTDATFESASYSYGLPTIENYSFLYFLSDVTQITDDDANYSVMMVNDLTHDAALFNFPDYTPSNTLNLGTGIFAEDDYYHAHMVSFLLLAKWFNFLKENDIYDNTRIIVVSDHGKNNKSPFPDNIILPNNYHVQEYNSLLMVKDFYSYHDFLTDYTFMTTADVPHIAAKGLADVLINPFTGLELAKDKDDGVFVTTSRSFIFEWQHRYKYSIKDNEWMHVKDNIFEPSNWVWRTFE